MSGLSGVIRRLLLSLCAATALLLACCGLATAGTFPVNICGASARDPGDGLSWSATSPLVATAECPADGPGLELYSPGATRQRRTTPRPRSRSPRPAGSASTASTSSTASSHGIGSNGWWGEFYWNGGPGPAGSSGPLNDGQFNAGGCCSQTQSAEPHRSAGSSPATSRPARPATRGIDRGMTELDLTAQEDRAPAIVATGTDNLWYQTGWVRGIWHASFSATDPSGVCGAAVVFGNLPAINTPTPDTSPNRHTWKQCPDQTVPAAVDTTASDGSLGRGEGAMALQLAATNTASVTAIASEDRRGGQHARRRLHSPDLPTPRPPPGRSTSPPRRRAARPVSRTSSARSTAGPSSAFREPAPGCRSQASASMTSAAALRTTPSTLPASLAARRPAVGR